jgi:formylglycine-generating enzyme required for sulfatase activity
MQGNVTEMVEDAWELTCYSQFGEQPAINPARSYHSGQRVDRGGNWFNRASECRSAFRNSTFYGLRLNFIGFRAALPVTAVRQTMRNQGG